MNTAARCNARSELIIPRTNGESAAPPVGVPGTGSIFELAALRVVMWVLSTRNEGDGNVFASRQCQPARNEKALATA